MSKDFQMNWIEILLQRTEEIAGQKTREKVQEGREKLPHLTPQKPKRK